MQTFLPAESFQECAQILDSQRLNKQRVECLQIYNALTGRSNGWINHPATRMWRRAEHLLCIYAIKISDECDRRGIADNTGVKEKFYEYMNRHLFYVPRWWADEKTKQLVIHTHRCNLLRKDYEYYRKFFPEVPASEIFVTDYHWPIK
jgi:hypothetical protein